MASTRKPKTPRKRRLAGLLVGAAALAVAGALGTQGALPQLPPGQPSALPQASAPAAVAEAAAPLDFADVPPYDGEPYVYVNGGMPQFTAADYAQPFGTEDYGQLDELGRATGAFAVVGPETEPTQKRQQLRYKPTGWQQAYYKELGLDHLYERSHLLAHSLTAEDDNPLNLITGTAAMNGKAMTVFERAVDAYVDSTGGHVLMRVEPVYQGEELVARGVHMQAWSVEDQGQAVCINVFCYNVQPGIEIDYATGFSWPAT